MEDQRGVWKYYTTEDDKYAMSEPNLWDMCHDAYLATLMRYDGLESGRRGIVLMDGTRVHMDKEERGVMARSGTIQTGQFARRTIALHVKERFTDVFATDGSKNGTRAAYGVWEGPAVVPEARVEEGRGESEEEIERRMAAGMHGGALPRGWGVTEAEMAAVVRALQIALTRDDGVGPGRRVMICTDSQATKCGPWKRHGKKGGTRASESTGKGL